MHARGIDIYFLFFCNFIGVVTIYTRLIRGIRGFMKDGGLDMLVKEKEMLGEA
jgi:hypothetical protein